MKFLTQIRDAILSSKFVSLLWITFGVMLILQSNENLLESISCFIVAKLIDIESAISKRA